MKLTFLGTGTSHGVPMIDCMLRGYACCPKNACREAERDPRHRRSRCSIHIEHEGAGILVDVSLDFREQALREKIERIDAVLLTHAHADHIGGIPDLRSYTMRMQNPLDLYASAETIGLVRQSFAYVFDPDTFVGGGIPSINTIPVNEPFNVHGLKIRPIPVGHGALAGCCGYRMGTVAYIPDMKTIDEKEIAQLQGLSVLVLNSLRDTPPHPTHLTLDESMALARKIKPKQCFFVHMSHDIHYQIDGEKLDEWMKFAYDGLVIEL